MAFEVNIHEQGWKIGGGKACILAVPVQVTHLGDEEVLLNLSWVQKLALEQTVWSAFRGKFGSASARLELKQASNGYFEAVFHL